MGENFAALQKELLYAQARVKELEANAQAPVKELEANALTCRSDLPFGPTNCSIVSSSGTLLLRDHGKDIDKASIVVRLSMGPLVNYKKHVGSRTTLRVIPISFLDYSRHSNFTAALREAHAVLRQESPVAVMWIPNHNRCTKHQKERISFESKHPLVRFSIANPSFLDSIRNLTKVPPSSGIVASFVALRSFCSSATFYGFDDLPASLASHVPYHYWSSPLDHTWAEKNSIGKHYAVRLQRGNEGHNFPLEHQILRSASGVTNEESDTFIIISDRGLPRMTGMPLQSMQPTCPCASSTEPLDVSCSRCGVTSMC